MACNKVIYNGTTTTAQVLTAGQNANIAIDSIIAGCGIAHIAGTSPITIKKRGKYLVNVFADVLPTAAGSTTIQLINGGTAISGAQATFTGVLDETEHVGFSTIINVKRSCAMVDNTAILQIQAVEGATITNLNINIVEC